MFQRWTQRRGGSVLLIQRVLSRSLMLLPFFTKDSTSSWPRPHRGRLRDYTEGQASQVQCIRSSAGDPSQRLHTLPRQEKEGWCPQVSKPPDVPSLWNGTEHAPVPGSWVLHRRGAWPGGLSAAVQIFSSRLALLSDLGDTWARPHHSLSSFRGCGMSWSGRTSPHPSGQPEAPPPGPAGCHLQCLPV